MGRDVQAQAQFGAATGQVRALLESDALILRGEVRLRLARNELLGWHAEGAALHLTTTHGALVLTMAGDTAQAEAKRWLAALNRPVPTLPEKLGVLGAVVWAITALEDAALTSALAEVLQSEGQTATLGLAVIRADADLARLLAACAAHPSLPVWAINEKGRQAGVSEGTIRTAMRAAGMVDVKACAVSPTLSGTRYHRGKG